MSQNEKKKIKIGVLSGLHHSHDHGLSIDEGRTFLSSYCAIQDYNTNPNRKFDIEPLYLNICDEVHVAFDIAKRLLKCEPPITALIVQSKKINSFLVPLFAGKPFGKQIPIYESQTNLIEFSSSQLFGSVTEPILREWNYFNAMIELMNAFDWRIYNLISSFESSSDTASCIKKSITKPNNKDHKTKVKEFPNDSECSKVPQIDCSYRLKDIETVLDENGYEDIDASCKFQTIISHFYILSS